MPIYGYRCGTCGHEFEILQRMSDPPLKACPKCSGELKKMVYAAGIIYKGSGYYSTDYKSGSKGSETASTNGSGSSESSGDAKPDAKPETSTDSKPATESKTESTTPKSDSTS